MKKIVWMITFAGLSSTSSIYAKNAFASDSPWMLGDGQGQRTALIEKGYDFGISYTGQGATVLDTQISSEKDSAYADQWSFLGNFDLNKILDWNDTEALINITYRSGQQVENKSQVLSPHISQVQEVYGRGQTWRLTDLWIKKKFFDQKLDVKIGRFGEGEDFASFDCEFQNLALCAGQIGHWSGDQWYNGPVSQWATRIKWNISPNLSAQVGIYEYNPENLKRSKGFNLSTDGSKGALLPIELIWKPENLIQNLAGEYRLGYYYSTADVTNVQIQNDRKEHKNGTWISAKQQLTSHAGDVNRGLTLMGQVAVYDNKTSIFNDAETLAVTYKGLFDQRKQDEIGLGISRIAVDSRQNPHLNNEINAELYYSLLATPWLKVRSNLQYIDRIGANKNQGDAWVAGLKFNLNF